MSEQKVHKDFISGVETETNTEGCPIVTLNDNKKYQTYPYPGFGFVGNSCGLYVQKATPATDSPKKQLWFDIPSPEEGKDAIVTKIVIEDRNSLSAELLKGFDDYISKYTNDKTPRKVLTGLNMGTDFKVLNKAGSEYRKVESALPQAPSPTEKEDAAADTTVESENSQHNFYELTALVGTDKEGSIDVLKFHGVGMRVKPSGEVTENTIKNGEILNKDSLTRVLCVPIQTVLQTRDETKEQFNRSDADIKNEKDELAVKSSKMEYINNNISNEINIYFKNNKSLQEIKDNKLDDEKLKSLGVQISITNYIDLQKILEKYHDASDDKVQLEEIKNIEKVSFDVPFMKGMYSGENALDKNKLFRFLKSSNENMSGMIKILNTIVGMDQNATTGQYMVKYTGKKMIVTGDKEMSVPFYEFAEKLAPFLFDHTSIKKMGQQADVNMSIRGQQASNFVKKVARSVGLDKVSNKTKKIYKDSSSKLGKDRGIVKGITSSFNTGLKNSEGFLERLGVKKPNAAATEEVPSKVGGKRKTRKNKARKTRRKVQRKRRQSKKH